MPNTENNEHVINFTYVNYLSYLHHDLPRVPEGNLGIITEDNYRINNNIAKVVLTINEYQAHFITYAVECEYTEQGQLIDTGVWRCFFVRNAIAQSGYVILTLELDPWATYYNFINASSILVERTTYNLSKIGIFDPIINAKRTSQVKYKHASFSKLTTIDESIDCKDAYIAESEMRIVFLVEYNVSQAVFSNDKTATTRMFYVDLSDLRTKLNTFYVAESITDTWGYHTCGGTQLIMDLIGGIYKFKDENNNITDARVIKCWLMPKKWANVSADGGDFYAPHNFIIKSQYTYLQDMLMHVSVISGNDEELTHTLVGQTSFNALKYKDSTFYNLITDSELNYKITFGTKNNFLIGKRTTEKGVDFTISCTISSDNVSVVIMQDEEEKEITSDFEVMLGTSNEDGNALRNIAGVLGKFILTGVGIGTAIATGNYVGAGMQAVGGVANLLPNQSHNIPQKQGSGDGYNNFWGVKKTINGNDVYYCRNPFIYAFYESYIDELTNIDYFGARYNYMETISTILGRSLLTNSAKPYLKGKLYYCDGIPKDALENIKQTFSNGIYLKSLT